VKFCCLPADSTVDKCNTGRTKVRHDFLPYEKLGCAYSQFKDASADQPNDRMVKI